MTRRDAQHVQRACNKAFAKIAGLFELLEAATPEDQKKNVASVRQMVMDAFHDMRQSIENNLERID